jgi:RNA polymerase-binding protein DksA
MLVACQSFLDWSAKMATATPMDIEQISSQLHARRNTIVSEIRAHEHNIEEEDNFTLTNDSGEAGDRAEMDLQSDTDIAMLGQEYAELRDLDGALARLENGTYGSCTDCGEPIPVERLRAQITAQRCLPCQIKEDKRHALEHGASL